MKLEQTIIRAAKQQLVEFKSYVTTPADDEEQLRTDVTSAFCRVTQLTGLAHITDSGLSDNGIKELFEIEKETNSLSRTFGWLYCK